MHLIASRLVQELGDECSSLLCVGGRFQLRAEAACRACFGGPFEYGRDPRQLQIRLVPVGVVRALPCGPVANIDLNGNGISTVRRVTANQSS